jgi:hypothetical protein
MLLTAAQKTIGTQPSNKRLVYARDTDKLIRLQSRIGYADTSVDLKNPLVLPQGSPIARLLMQQSHSCQKHTGVDSTLVGFLGNHWTPEARRLAKKVLGSCPTCRRVRGPTFQLPPMPQLPVDRVRPTRAFEAIGIDYLGPSTTKGIDGSTNKVWILLITCLSTRAVHLEPVWSLTTEEFLEVFRQFAATRGNPLRILSDNGRQFVLAAKVLADSEFATIQWHFIAALSPWQGGVYERLVSLVKRAFKACIGRRVLTEIEFRTFIKETEACLNCRPLTFVSTEGDAAASRRLLGVARGTALGSPRSRRGTPGTSRGA